MPNNDPNFEENVKKAFKSVKEDIDNLKSDINDLKDAILKIMEKLDFNSQNKEDIDKNSYKKDKIDLFEGKSSIGNGGVKNIRQQTTTDNNARQFQAVDDFSEPTANMRKAIDSLIYKVEDLTDREFSVFLAIYELGLKQQTIAYFDVAQQLKITESWVRTTVGTLIKKGIPVSKERFFNKQSSLFIPEELNSPFIIKQLIKARQKKYVQKTLLDL